MVLPEYLGGENTPSRQPSEGNPALRARFSSIV